MGAVKSYLLDTHTFLWAVQEDDKLSAEAKLVLEDLDSRLYLSAISAFEVSNKYRLGKLPEYEYIVENYGKVAQKLGVMELPITTDHAHFAAKFAWENRDPFDRILAAQASIENLTLITNDAAFEVLPWVNTLW
jgi:PIN domain nuclease of toxin-antitoxin system